MKAYSYSAYLTKVKETLNQLSASAQQQFYRRCPIKNKTAGVNTTLPSCDQFRYIHIPYIYIHIYNTPYISPPHTQTHQQQKARSKNMDINKYWSFYYKDEAKDWQKQQCFYLICPVSHLFVCACCSYAVCVRNGLRDRRSSPPTPSFHDIIKKSLIT